MTAPKLLHDPLQPSNLKHGAQGGKLVPCERSQHHPHFPSNETCAWCAPEEPVRDEEVGFGEQYYVWCSAGGPGSEWTTMSAESKTKWHEMAEQTVRDYWALYSRLPEWAPPAARRLIEKAATIPAPPMMPAPATPNNWATIGGSTAARICINCCQSFQGPLWRTLCPGCMCSP